MSTGGGAAPTAGRNTTDFWPHSFHATPVGLMLKYRIQGGTVPRCPPPPFRRLWWLQGKCYACVSCVMCHSPCLHWASHTSPGNRSPMSSLRTRSPEDSIDMSQQGVRLIRIPPRHTLRPRGSSCLCVLRIICNPSATLNSTKLSLSFVPRGATRLCAGREGHGTTERGPRSHKTTPLPLAPRLSARCQSSTPPPPRSPSDVTIALSDVMR